MKNVVRSLIVMLSLSLFLMAGCDNGEPTTTPDYIDNSLLNGTWIIWLVVNSDGAKLIFDGVNYEFHQTIGTLFDTKDTGTYEATKKGKLTLYRTSRIRDGLPYGPAQEATLNTTYKLISNKLIWTVDGTELEFTKQVE